MEACRAASPVNGGQESRAEAGGVDFSLRTRTPIPRKTISGDASESPPFDSPERETEGRLPGQRVCGSVFQNAETEVENPGRRTFRAGGQAAGVTWTLRHIIIRRVSIRPLSYP